MDAALRAELIAFCGVETSFNDAWGQPVTVTEADQLQLLQAQGFAIDDDALAREQLLERQLDFWLQLLQLVSVQAADTPLQLLLQVDLLQATEPMQCALHTEDGRTEHFTLVPVEGELVQVVQLDETEYHQYQHTLPFSLAAGYHQLVLQHQDMTYSQQLIVTPAHCYQPAAFTQKKQWGIALQLYGLRSERNWGIGDFTDLANTVRYLASVGADFVGLNPIHALYPALPENASPYSPSSRRWLNISYIDVSAMPGFNQCQRTAALVQAPEFARQLAEQRSKDYVDYTGVMQLKLPAMRSLYQWFVEQGGHTDAEFMQFLQQGGASLQQLALYDALHVQLYQQDNANWGWPVWPEQYRDPQSDAVQQFAEQHQADIGFYCYLQYIAQRQLAAAQQIAKDAGMLLGLYRDLAVGVSEASTEIWGNADLYCRNASIGAPPDPLGPAGQNWGLPPMLPYQLYKQGYQPFIDLLRANMRDAGALRIDHVMALLRLWWVPKTAADASGGAYLYYPIMDLLGILALESQRNAAVVIGEDLGTVPEGIRELLADYGVYSYRVFFFETAADGGYLSPAHYPAQAMATLTTHDLPTLIGFWHCDDLRLGKELGLYKNEIQLQQLYGQRHANKQRILDSLHGHQVLPQHYNRSSEHLAMDQTLNFAMQRHLAATSSQLLCLQLEDALEMSQPVNIPGTSSEYPNWRRKLTQNIEQWQYNAQIRQLFVDISTRRASS
ncbi:MAG: 4-alpha-glucanotransferase [Gammaproteobacteria bacterium]|nr:4-alpha-glucanotransferase [Gammaproteobacteria bacterium]MBU1556843.1 4-alpha-glucanotransferase [Gammaproteobacteria bacterium]MBU2068893.1 4-alpha-glucanotransferase [Gammaproteobacteria bacterium]MBU2184944.1 4-alpha-glucanotransferase [Gammaproteobacteria bacterium]MBU2204225.1 4-alpha-glucanotransferase [Gammaproteobacteria bacterium]